MSMVRLGGRQEFIRTSTFILAGSAVAGVAGAIQLLSILNEILPLRGVLIAALDMWRLWASPFAQYLFSWIDLIIPMPLPAIVFDNLLLGLILAIGFLRFAFSGTWHLQLLECVGYFLTALFLWPVYLVAILQRVLGKYDQGTWGELFVLFSPIYAAIFFLVVNYAFLFLGIG
jgi:hypothetical protein